MSVQVEKLEHNMAKLTIEVEASKFDAAMKKAYNKKKGSFNLPGFRKGKVPMYIIEKEYGAGVFYEDAANELMPEAYAAALEESGLEVVSRPEVDVTQIGKGQNFIFTAEVATKPEVTLGDYKGLEVPKSETEVTDEEVEAELKKEQEKNSRTISVEDRAAQLNDIVTIDFEGSVDGVPFDGGQATEYPLTLGSNTFIPGFEDQLVGANTGDHVEVKVTFPEEYQAKELAGKEAVFQCDVKKIETKEVPELDDEFAKDVSEFDTLDEYKADIKAKLIEKKEKENKAKKEDAVIEKIIEGSQMEIADDMVSAQTETMLREFAQNIQMQGINIEQYMQLTGNTAQGMMEQMKPQAVKRIQSRLVLEEIAKAEGIEVSDEEVDEKLSDMAKTYGVELSTLKDSAGESELEQIKDDIKVEKAVELVTDAAVEK